MVTNYAVRHAHRIELHAQCPRGRFEIAGQYLDIYGMTAETREAYTQAGGARINDRA